MNPSRTFARDYTRLFALLALPLGLVLVAKLLFGLFPSAGYQAGGRVFNGETLLLAAHVGTDLLTGLSYVWIAAVLGWIVYRVRDAIPYHTVMLAFSAFIISCGANHLAHVWTMFQPNYWMEATIKGVMAVSSVATAVAILPIVPSVVALVRSAQLSERRAAEIRSRDEFLRVAAHEFKTPIAAIVGYTELLERRAGPAMPPRDRRALEVIGEQSTRLTRLVEGLLDLSRIETGRFEVTMAPMSFSRLVTDLVEQTRPMLDQHTITLDDQAPDLYVLGDEHRLVQVVENLLGNAVKYSPQGGPIRVRLTACDSRATLSVADHGIGIPQRALPHLFERFFRAGNVDQHGVLPGFGVGLYVVKEILDLHGGSISVCSEERSGTTFTVSLPLITPSEP